MDRQYVTSSAITSIGFDPNTSTLEIEFSKNSAVWQYYNFPESTYYEFIGSDSLGKFFLDHIKEQYSENRVG